YGWNINRGSGGRAGRGIYFWKECEHYIVLARGWYTQALAEGRYQSDTSECRIIIADLEANEDEILDLDDRDLKEKIFKLAKKNNLPYNSTKEVARLFDTFVTRLQSETGKIFKILLA